ncbi:MAG TPA: hypothetical protein PKL13_04630, partial [bacterium]|nr:hypothetical protein [bacterium]
MAFKDIKWWGLGVSNILNSKYNTINFNQSLEIPQESEPYTATIDARPLWHLHTNQEFLFHNLVLNNSLWGNGIFTKFNEKQIKNFELKIVLGVNVDEKTFVVLADYSFEQQKFYKANTDFADINNSLGFFLIKNGERKDGVGTVRITANSKVVYAESECNFQVLKPGDEVFIASQKKVVTSINNNESFEVSEPFETSNENVLWYYYSKQNILINEDVDTMTIQINTKVVNLNPASDVDFEKIIKPGDKIKFYVNNEEKIYEVYEINNSKQLTLLDEEVDFYYTGKFSIIYNLLDNFFIEDLERKILIYSGYSFLDGQFLRHRIPSFLEGLKTYEEFVADSELHEVDPAEYNVSKEEYEQFYENFKYYELFDYPDLNLHFEQVNLENFEFPAAQEINSIPIQKNAAFFNFNGALEEELLAGTRYFNDNTFSFSFEKETGTISPTTGKFSTGAVKLNPTTILKTTFEILYSNLESELEKIKLNEGSFGISFFFKAEDDIENVPILTLYNSLNEYVKIFLSFNETSKFLRIEIKEDVDIIKEKVIPLESIYDFNIENFNHLYIKRVNNNFFFYLNGVQTYTSVFTELQISETTSLFLGGSDVEIELCYEEFTFYYTNLTDNEINTCYKASNLTQLPYPAYTTKYKLSCNKQKDSKFYLPIDDLELVKNYYLFNQKQAFLFDGENYNTNLIESLKNDYLNYATTAFSISNQINDVGMFYSEKLFSGANTIALFKGNELYASHNFNDVINGFEGIINENIETCKPGFITAALKFKANKQGLITINDSSLKSVLENLTSIVIYFPLKFDNIVDKQIIFEIENQLKFYYESYSFYLEDNAGKKYYVNYPVNTTDYYFFMLNLDEDVDNIKLFINTIEQNLNKETGFSLTNFDETFYFGDKNLFESFSGYLDNFYILNDVENINVLANAMFAPSTNKTKIVDKIFVATNDTSSSTELKVAKPNVADIFEFFGGSVANNAKSKIMVYKNNLFLFNSEGVYYYKNWKLNSSNYSLENFGSAITDTTYWEKIVGNDNFLNNYKDFVNYVIFDDKLFLICKNISNKPRVIYTEDFYNFTDLTVQSFPKGTESYSLANYVDYENYTDFRAIKKVAINQADKLLAICATGNNIIDIIFYDPDCEDFDTSFFRKEIQSTAFISREFFDQPASGINYCKFISYKYDIGQTNLIQSNLLTSSNFYSLTNDLDGNLFLSFQKYSFMFDSSEDFSFFAGWKNILNLNINSLYIEDKNNVYLLDNTFNVLSTIKFNNYFYTIVVKPDYPTGTNEERFLIKYLLKEGKIVETKLNSSFVPSKFKLSESDNSFYLLPTKIKFSNPGEKFSTNLEDDKIAKLYLESFNNISNKSSYLLFKELSTVGVMPADKPTNNKPLQEIPGINLPTGCKLSLAECYVTTDVGDLYYFQNGVDYTIDYVNWTISIPLTSNIYGSSIKVILKYFIEEKNFSLSVDNILQITQDNFDNLANYYFTISFDSIIPKSLYEVLAEEGSVIAKSDTLLGNTITANYKVLLNKYYVIENLSKATVDIDIPEDKGIYILNKVKYNKEFLYLWIRGKNNIDNSAKNNYSKEELEVAEEIDFLGNKNTFYYLFFGAGKQNFEYEDVRRFLPNFEIDKDTIKVIIRQDGYKANLEIENMISNSINSYLKGEFFNFNENKNWILEFWDFNKSFISSWGKIDFDKKITYSKVFSNDAIHEYALNFFCSDVHTDFVKYFFETTQENFAITSLQKIYLTPPAEGMVFFSLHGKKNGLNNYLTVGVKKVENNFYPFVRYGYPSGGYIVDNSYNFTEQNLNNFDIYNYFIFSLIKEKDIENNKTYLKLVFLNESKKVVFSKELTLVESENLLFNFGHYFIIGSVADRELMIDNPETEPGVNLVFSEYGLNGVVDELFYITNFSFEEENDLIDRMEGYFKSRLRICDDKTFYINYQNRKNILMGSNLNPISLIVRDEILTEFLTARQLTTKSISFNVLDYDFANIYSETETGSENNITTKLTGTVSVAVATKDLIGDGTLFTEELEKNSKIRIGDSLNGVDFWIADIIDNTHALLTFVATDNYSGDVYLIKDVSSTRLVFEIGDNKNDFFTFRTVNELNQIQDLMWIGRTISNRRAVFINGDLYLSGSTFSVNTQEYNIKDKWIMLNEGELGSGLTGDENSGFVIDRGLLAELFIGFDESDKKIKFATYNTITHAIIDEIFSVNINTHEVLIKDKISSREQTVSLFENVLTATFGNVLTNLTFLGKLNSIKFNGQESGFELIGGTVNTRSLKLDYGNVLFGNSNYPNATLNIYGNTNSGYQNTLLLFGESVNASRGLKIISNANQNVLEILSDTAGTVRDLILKAFGNFEIDIKSNLTIENTKLTLGNSKTIEVLENVIFGNATYPNGTLNIYGNA